MPEKDEKVGGGWFVPTDKVFEMKFDDGAMCAHKPTPDPVKAPAHYAGDGEVDCMRAMRSMAAGYDEAEVPAGVSYWMLSALKYVWRAPLKNGAEDVRKAIQCLEYALGEMG